MCTSFIYLKKRGFYWTTEKDSWLTKILSWCLDDTTYYLYHSSLSVNHAFFLKGFTHQQKGLNKTDWCDTVCKLWCRSLGDFQCQVNWLLVNIAILWVKANKAKKVNESKNVTVYLFCSCKQIHWTQQFHLNNWFLLVPTAFILKLT